MTRSLPLTIDTADSVNAVDLDTPKPQIPQKQMDLLPTSSSGTRLPIQQFALDKTLTRHNNNYNNDITSNHIGAEFADAREDDAEQELESNAALPPLPYEEDQSAETLNQHTNFIFNWHARNSDISAIEPLHKPDLNILTIAALSDIQKPLLFGVMAGTFLLAFILLLYVCMLRQQRVPSDKAALIGEDCDAQSVVVSLPPAATMTPQRIHNGIAAAEACRNPAICSRNALKV